MTLRSFKVPALVLALAAVALLLAARAGLAQGEEPSQAAQTPGSEATPIEQKIETLEAATEPEASIRESAIAAYRQALAAQQQIDQEREAQRRIDELIADGRERIREARERVAALRAQDPEAIALPEADDSDEVVPLLEQARAETATLRSQLEQVRRELSQQANRPIEIRDKIAQQEEARSRLQEQLAVVGADGTLDPVLREARQESLRTQIAATQAAVARLQKDLVGQPIRAELLEEQRKELAARLALTEARAVALESMLAALRKSEALAAIADAGVDVPSELAGNPAVRALRQANYETAQVLRQLTDLSEDTRTARDEARSRAAEIRESLEQAQRKLEIAGGSNQVVGQILLEQRRSLPNLPAYRARVSQREAEARLASLRALELEDELQKLASPERYLREKLPIADEADPRLLATLRDLAGGRLALVKETAEANEQYLRRLSELAFEEDGVLRTTREFDDFLSKRLLWIRNREALGPETLRAVPGDLRQLLDPAWWSAALEGARHALGRPIGLAALLVVLGMVAARRRLVAALKRTAEGVGKPSVDTFWQTLAAVGLTVLLGAPLTVGVALLGYAMLHGPRAGLAAHEMGTALLNLAPMIFVLSVLRALCLPGGLAQAHFRWDARAVRRLRRQLGLLWVTFLLPGLLTQVAIHRTDGTASGETVRLLLLALLGGLTFFLYRFLHPGRGIARALNARALEAGTSRRDWAVLILALLIPLWLAAQTIYGYVYSAGTFLGGLVFTLWLLAALWILQEVIYRWLLVARRRIQLQQILRRREAAREAEEASQGGEETEAPPASADAEVDLQSLDADTRKLVHIAMVLAGAGGLFLIWSGVLPALTVLEDVTLWRTTAGTGPEGEARPVSLGDVLLSALVAFLTVVGARTVPSVIEIGLRQQRSVARGSRVAFATLSRYAIVVLGAFIALNLLGASWSKLQWLVAALGVGIGFGLQEIVANFISGLIILVERPIRVGDVVTVGEVEGTVTRIQIRATTVTNWARQEHLVPNREFITGRVTNWSLSDEVMRLVVPVGVAYGSDVERALELLLECAREHPAVLAEPAAYTGFYSFGDNALGLELRVYVGRIGDLLSTKTDLHRAINRKFAAAGIEIAFPQRDVHLDSRRPLEVTLRREAGKPSSREASNPEAVPKPAG